MSKPRTCRRFDCTTLAHRGSLVLAAGIPAKVASEKLGHSTIFITLDTYSHLLPGLAEDAAEHTAALIYGSR